MDDRCRRRTVLAALATVPALSGCTALRSDDDTDDESTDDDSPDDDSPGDDAPDGDDQTETDDGDDESTEPDPTAVATDFVEDLGAGAFEDANDRVVDRFQEQLGPGLLETVWLGFTAVSGEYREIVETEESEYAVQYGVAVTMAFEDGEHALDVSVDEGAVAGIEIADEYERPDYVDLDAFAEDALDVEAEECDLPATVTVPDDADEPVPGVVFVHGTGPADRDASTVGTKAFADLAEGLATRGVASLRYDDRLRHCEPDPEDHTLDRVTVDDALVAIEELRATDGVDEDAIVIVGLSQGGMAAPRIAERDGELTGAVAMAPPARPFEELILEQNEHLASVGEHEWAAVAADLERLEADAERVRTGAYNPDDSLLNFPGGFWDSLAEYDQFETARAFDAPLYVLQGERDFQVTVEGDYERWQDELADRPNTEFELYDGLNHRFMPGEGPSTDFEYFVRNNVDERVIDDIAGWIDAL